MAVIKMNDLVESVSGKVGKLVFRTYYGKTYLSSKPSKPEKQSELQRANRSKFKLATEYAKSMMKNAGKKAYYTRIARKLELPNAYTAAITDYMRKPEIHGVDTGKYTAKAGGSIRINARKKDFSLDAVNVIVTSPDDKIIELGAAQFKAGEWIFKSALASRDPYASCVIHISATDHLGVSTQKIVFGD
jgi:hypothetical protein